MGSFLDKPKTEKFNESSEGSGLRYGLSSMQGWRTEMEDAHSAVLTIPGLQCRGCWFAIFDGHAGGRVSKQCSDTLLECITSREGFMQAIHNESSIPRSAFEEKLRTCVRAGFLEQDKRLRCIPELCSGEDKSGSTAICVLVTDNSIVFCNCGDSRGVLSRKTDAYISTIDHKPSNIEEHSRIVAAGGSVIIERVNGCLAVSRALGDFEYKNVENKEPTEQLVSPDPELYIVERDNELDQFIVLACDGVWDVMTSDDVCKFVASRLEVSHDLESISNDVIDCCLSKGSRDNMSIVIITLDGAPKLNDSSIELDENLDAIIIERLKGILKEDESKVPTFVDVYLRLFDDSKDLPNLPPGGGIHAKKSLMEKTYKEIVPQSDYTSSEDATSKLAGILYSKANRMNNESD